MEVEVAPRVISRLCGGKRRATSRAASRVSSIWRRENTSSTPFLVCTFALSDFVVVFIRGKAGVRPLLSVLDVYLFPGTSHGVSSQRKQDHFFTHGRTFQVSSRNLITKGHTSTRLSSIPTGSRSCSQPLSIAYPVGGKPFEQFGNEDLQGPDRAIRPDNVHGRYAPSPPM